MFRPLVLVPPADRKTQQVTNKGAQTSEMERGGAANIWNMLPVNGRERLVVCLHAVLQPANSEEDDKAEESVFIEELAAKRDKQ